MKPPLFTAENLSTGYGKKDVLSNISFSLTPGTITGLLGANGSGKSTLLKALCRQLPYQGICRLKSRPLTDWPLRKLAGAVSYIPQRSGISISLPLIDVVSMGFNPDLKLLEKPSPTQQEKARRALALVGLAGMEMEDYLTLSEGQKQLCILARTIVENTFLLLLDEPDSALDFHNKYHMMQILQRLIHDQEKAALICLHDPNLALDYCDQLLLLKDGRCLTSLHPAADSPAQMQEALSKIYGSVSLIQCRDEQNCTRLVLLSKLQTGALPSSIGCVIMASGFGRRFGGNKLLADFCGKPMISHILDCTASLPGLHRLVVTRYEEIADLCQKEGVEVLCHTLPFRNDTIRLGLEKLLESFRLSGCIFCPSDQPLLSPKSIDALLQAFSHHPDKICRLCYEGKAASPVIFGQKFFEELLTLPKDAGGSYLAKKYPAQVILVPAQDPFELYDVDTPEALQHLSESASAHFHP